MGFTPSDVRWLTLREFRLARHGIYEAKFAEIQANATIHGVKVEQPAKRLKIPELTNEQIEQRVREIMGG